MRRTHDEDGIAGMVLVIVIAWALSAVVLLTGILVAAQQIDDQVAFITGEVTQIDEDLDNVAFAGNIVHVSGDILEAAEPLEGQLDSVIDSVDSIDPTARNILQTAQGIDSTVNQIHGTASQINTTVASIRGHFVSINNSTDSIGPNIKTAARQANAIGEHVFDIKDDTGAILNQLDGDDGIQAHAENIDDFVNLNPGGLLDGVLGGGAGGAGAGAGGGGGGGGAGGLLNGLLGG